jgi:uncharacterized protein
MIFSRYLRVIERDGVVAVFHALRPVPIFLSATVWQDFCLSMSNQELSLWLHDQGLLVEDESQDDLFRDVIVREVLGGKAMSILYLVLTKACNFRCRQCFQYERHPDLYPWLSNNASLMSRETARLGIDAFVRHIEDSDEYGLERQIYFYGGEPLLNWDVLTDAVQYVEILQKDEALKDVRCVVITNGSLVDREKARFFADHGIVVGLSVDGPQEKNDAYRITAKGIGTYDLIHSALKILKEYRVNVSLSITINPNIALELPRIVRWAKEEMGIDSISFNMVGGSSYSYAGHEMSLEDYNEVLAKGLVEAYVAAKEIGVYEDRVARKVSDFANHLFKAVDCGAINNQLVIQPDGAIAFCHASTEYNVGSVADPNFRIFGHPSIRVWESVLPIHNPKCQTCPAISVCGYGCFHHVLELGEDLADKDRQFCKHTRSVMEFMVWDLLEKSRQELLVTA